MRLLILAVGQLKDGPERALAERYAARARGLGKTLGLSEIKILECAEGRGRRSEERKLEEGRALRARIPPGALIVLLDEGGKSPTSAAFAAALRNWRDNGARDLVFIIGGADGLDPDLRADAAQILCFGAMTLPHQLVRILVLEQIYRAITLIAGHPYHRA